MGSCETRELTEDDKSQLKSNKEIDSIIKTQKAERQVKIIVLGTGDSGKSTFIRQIYSQHGPDKELSKDKAKFLNVIKVNCLDSFKALLLCAQEHQYKVPEKLVPMIETVLEAEKLTVEVAKTMNKIWSKSKIQEAYMTYNHLLQIGSNEPYFWEKAKDIAHEDYTPDREDIIRAKLKTFGILDFEFVYNNCKFNLVDVGGQRSERRKWIHCFDKVNSVIYLSAIDEYDGKPLFEDDNASRFVESLMLFERLSSSAYFENTPFILFLNKIDLFENKIKHFPLSEAFPDDYENFVKNNNDCAEAETELDKGILFLREIYSSRYRGNETLYIFETNAIDKEMCAKIFDSIRDQVIFANMSRSGL